MIVLPGPILLRDDAPLPDGWRRPALAWRDPATVEVVSTPVAPATPDPCTCSGHGPDLACEEHGPALRAWQREHAPREYAAALEAAAMDLLASRDASEVVVGTRDAEALALAHARTRAALATLRATLAPEVP